MNDEKSLTQRVFDKSTLKTAFFAIIVSIFASILYDIGIKPGASYAGILGQKIVGTIFHSARDQSYIDAATDPSAKPSLILILLFYSAVVAINISLLFSLYFRFKIKTSEQQIKYRWKNSKLPLAIRIFLSINLMVGILVGLVYVTMLNNSILVWRTFNNHLDSIAPFITNEQKIKLKSDFALVRNKSDYTKIEDSIRSIANENKINLIKSPIW